MNRIENLLQTLAPKGVEFRKLGDIGEFYGGLVGKSKKSFSQGNKFYVPYVNVFNNPQLDLNALESVQIGDKEKQNTIQLGDVLFTGSSENLEDCAMSCVVTQKIEKDIYLNSFCFGFRFFDKNLFNPSFLKHFLRDYNFRKNISKVANGVTRFNVSRQLLSQITIPIPPLEIQQEIVKILDQFSALTTDLLAGIPAEIEARKKQYEYYQNMLLDFNDINQNHQDAKERLAQKTYPKNLKTLLQTLAPKGVEFRKLGEVINILKGKQLNKELLLDYGEYPVMNGGIYASGYWNEYNTDYPKIIISQGGASAGYVNYMTSKFWAGAHCYAIELNSEKLNYKFLYYFLKNSQTILMKSQFGASIPALNKADIETLTIPIPPLEVQQEIVKILDQFSILTTDLLAGIPAEIKARKKQYEYYREKLLTFKPLTPQKEVKK
ncbi:hypothetical protein VN0212_05420 [Helicobacter pylori]|nr:hypothetical protein VN0212_05420 [Helicobacter pylori]